MKIILVHNAKAGERTPSTSELIALLERHGHSAVAVDLQRLDGAQERLRAGDLVVAAGGDGTQRAVAFALVGQRVPFAPLPLGTANNVARSLGIKGSPEEIISSWRNAEHRTIDIGIAEGPWGKKYFLEGMGVGLIGRAIAILDEIDLVDREKIKDRRAKLQRDLHVLVALAHEIHPIHVAVRGTEPDLDDNYILLELLNIRRAGPAVQFAPLADASDGLLDLVMAPVDHRAQLIDGLHKRLAGDENTPPLLSSKRVSRVDLVLSPTELRIDDEVVLRSADFKEDSVRVSVRVERGALTVLSPKKDV